MIVPKLVLALALLAKSALAEKDGNVYPWGSNPNENKKMFWKDSINVLEDLDEFESLFIRVHGCVWSPYYDADMHDDDDQTDDDGDEAARDGDENWYLYRSQSFRANTAFSLYGVLKGDLRAGRHCVKSTYINSFFTFDGAAKFSGLFGIYDDLATNECVEVEGGESNDKSGDSGDRRRLSGSGSGDDGYSATLGCSAYGDFEWAEFGNSYCDGHNYMNGTDTMDSYNKQMLGGNFNCRKVYSRWRNIQGRQLEDAGDDADAAVDDAAVDDQYYNYADDMVAYADDDLYGNYSSIGELILASSFSCDIVQYPNGACPDPYGLKMAYSNAMENARTGTNGTTPLPIKLMRVSSSLFLLAAASLFLASYLKSREKEDGIISRKDYLLQDENGMTKSTRTSNSKRSSKKSSRRSPRKSPSSKKSSNPSTPTAEQAFPQVEVPEDESPANSPPAISPKKQGKWFGKKDNVVVTTGPTEGSLV